MRFSLPDLIDLNFNELGSVKTRSFSNSPHPLVR